MISRCVGTLTRGDMASSVQNAANYKSKRVEPESQNPFRPMYLDSAVSFQPFNN